MANKASPKKVVKNIEKPRLQRQTCTVFKHFEPTIDLSACRVNLQATIPLVTVESDEEPPVAVPPKRFRAKPPRNVHVFKSSSSSSLESKVEKFCNRSKSTTGDSRRTTKARRAVKSARENASSVHASNAVVKSVTDPALIQRERNLKALKQEILVNRRPTIAQTGQDTNSPRLAALKSEIHQSRTDNVLHKKVLITELRSEIAQYKQFSKYQVYSNYEGNVAAKKEHSEPVDNSAPDRRTDAGSDKSQSEPETGPSSGADSLDDTVIRSKIDEANQLIARVKKALGKIKSRKPCEAFEAKSSSTDIEETIRALKQETEQLITGDSDAEETQLKTPTTVEDEEIAVPPPRQSCLQHRNPLRNIELQRPKTRRIEADDDLSTPVQRNKFINRPEIGQLPISSSFEQLQEKLETISETTESTPRKPVEHQQQLDKACNTEPLRAESKGVQVAPATNTVGACCSCPKENKKIQANGGWAKKNVAVETEPLSPIKQLEIQNLAPADIPSRRKCSGCQADFLPPIEILPIPQVCGKCKVALQQENLPGCCIRPKSKLKKLTIQVLPPIVIKQGLTLRQVLNLSIDPNGKSNNKVQDTENVAYFATTSNDLRVSWSSKKKEDVWFSDDPISTPLGENEENFNFSIGVEDIEGPDVGPVEVQGHAEQGRPLFPTFPTNQSSFNQPGGFLHDIDKENQFVSNSHLQPPGNIDDLLAELAESQNLSPELEAQLRNRVLWYKSYHIYDNPNKHVPEPLDTKSLEKLSQIDLQFYKTFINPNPTLSQEIFTPHASRNKLMGFESKMVQCNESMLLDELQAPEAQRASVVENENELESTITVLRMKEADKQQQKPSEERHPESYSSPSEVTVTISYSVSSEERLMAADSKKSISELHETEVKTIDLEDYQELPTGLEDKVINVKDKQVISKLRDKLKSVDTRASQPTFTLKKQTADEETVDQFLKGLTKFKENMEESGQQHSVDSSSKDSQNRPTSVNYLLSQHLELGKNGRYRDEENLFAQVPHPKIAKPFREPKPTHPDQEIARDGFGTLLRHQVQRFFPDASNSETVTSNSVSEGEVRCKHSVSNGEIHRCRSHWPPRRQRTILTKRHFPLPLSLHDGHNRGALGKFNLDDPKLSIEQRRNYFNNWVTYYVKPQDVYESTTSSCSNNK